MHQPSHFLDPGKYWADDNSPRRKNETSQASPKNIVAETAALPFHNAIPNTAASSKIETAEESTGD